MTEDLNCPVEGCDFRGEYSSVKGHITAKSDPAHQWSELRDELDDPNDQAEGSDGRQTDDPNDQGDDPPSGGPEGGGSDPAGDDDQADQDAQDAQAGEEGESDQDDMPSKQDLDRQRAQYDQDDHPPEGDSDGGSKGTDSGPSGTSDPGLGGIPVPVSTTTLMMGAAIVLMLALLYAYTRDSSESTATHSVDEQADDSDVKEAIDEATEGGGLMSEDPADTGDW